VQTGGVEAIRLFGRSLEDSLGYFDLPSHLWVSLRTTNPLEQLISKLRDWTMRFNYFRGRANLELALYSYLCQKEGRLVPRCLHPVVDMHRTVPDQEPTLFAA